MNRQLFEGLEKENLIILLEHLTSTDLYLANDRAIENQVIVNRLLTQQSSSILKAEPEILPVPLEKKTKKNRDKNVGGDKFDISK
jgi:hypothetical protein